MSSKVQHFITTLLPLLDELYADFHRYVDKDWNLAERYFPLTQLNSTEKEKRGAAIVSRLKERISNEELAKAAAEIICAPDEVKETLREVDASPDGSKEWR
ncbi:MAG TPA: hypothetical protein VGB77_06835, partial [Abditibacteriaceae bacterium]